MHKLTDLALPLTSRRDLSCVQIAHELQVLRELNCSYELKPPPVTGRSSPMRRVAKPPSSRHGHRKGRRSAIETEPQTAGPEAAEILNLDPSTGSNASGAGQPSGGGAADDWQRPAGLPSWNSCFRCDFSYCNGYNGGHTCLPARAAQGGVGCREWVGLQICIRVCVLESSVFMRVWELCRFWPQPQKPSLVLHK